MRDSKTIPTHPNAAGHKVMGLAIAGKLPMLANAFWADKRTGKC